MRILALPAALLLTIGCAVSDQRVDDVDGDAYPVDVTNEDWAYNPSDELLEGSMSGELPGTELFSRDLTRSRVNHFGSLIDFEFHALGADWAMIMGSVDTDSLVEGETTELPYGVIVCSGPAENVFDYDAPADTVEVTMTTTAEGMLLVIDAGLDNGDHVTTKVVIPEI